jgi:hypothetical protein
MAIAYGLTQKERKKISEIKNIISNLQTEVSFLISLFFFKFLM